MDRAEQLLHEVVDLLMRPPDGLVGMNGPVLPEDNRLVSGDMEIGKPFPHRSKDQIIELLHDRCSFPEYRDHPNAFE